MVFELVTGTRGAFTTQILYIVSEFVSPEVSYFRLEKADYDGRRAQVLLESREPIMSPSWSPKRARHRLCIVRN